MRMDRSGWRRLSVGLAGVVALTMGLHGALARAGGTVMAAGATQSQRPTPPSPSPASNYNATPLDPSDPLHAKMQERQIASAANDRHKRLVTDADKLLQLATELKQDVDSTTKNEMSVATIKKAAEIEKLAHDVKERMKGE